MPENKKKTIVEFAGGLKDLVIKVGGKIVYSGEKEYKSKTHESEKAMMGLAQMAMVSKFASCIYNVPALRYIWKYSRFRKTDRAGVNKYSDEKSKSGKPSTYNKIVSANRRGLLNDLRPNSNNMIVPHTIDTLSKTKAILSYEGIKIKNDYPESFFMFPYAQQKMTPVGIICPFDPKKKSKTRFEMISKWYDIEEFTPRKYAEFFFRFDTKDVEIMSKYSNCIAYFTFVENSNSGIKTKWYQFGSEEFSLGGYPEKEIVFRQDPAEVRTNEKYYLKE